MDTPKRLSFLSYAVNGAGVGHVVRQVAIQRWLRRLCAFCGTKSEHWFLTTSEADTLCFHEGFSAFKLPSKTIVDDAGLDKPAYIAMAKQWVWNSLTLLRPDVLIVDTFPNGSFHELGNALDVVRHKALVLRPVKQPFARRGAFQSLVQLYDRVVVPEHEDDEPGLLDELGLPPSRVAFSGPVVRSERFDAFTRDEARKRLGVSADKRVVLVTGGGGGDGSVDALFDAVSGNGDLHSDVHSDVHIVWAAGPLFRGAPRRGPSSTWFNGHDLAEHLAAVDVAVCAAGFNTIHELLFAGVPTLVVPQTKVADDQLARAQRYAARGALRVSSLAALAGDVRALLDDDAARAALRERALSQMPQNHARDAAREILSLVLLPSLLKAAVAALDDAFVKAAGDAGAAVSDVVDLALAVQGRGDRADVDVKAALALSTTTGAPPLALSKIVEQLKKKSRVDDAAGLVVDLFDDPAVSGQHGGLLALLSALQPERAVDGRALVAAIKDAADRAAGNGKDLMALARTLPVAFSDDGRSANLARLVAAAKSEAKAV